MMFDKEDYECEFFSMMLNKPININSYSEHCPHCDSENITMIGDPEYNDEWECDDCKKLFSSFLIKGKK